MERLKKPIHRKEIKSPKRFGNSNLYAKNLFMK